MPTEHLEIGDRQRRGVDVHAADAVLVPRTRCRDLTVVARLDRLGNVLGRRRLMFAVDRDETLVSDTARKDVDLLLELVHRQHTAFLQFVALTEAAVLAAVHAEIGHVERRKDNNAVVVDFLLDAQGRRTHLGKELGIKSRGHQNGGLFGEERLARRLALGEDLPHLHGIGRLHGDLVDATENLRLVNKMLAARQILVDFRLNDEILRVIRRGRELPDR